MCTITYLPNAGGCALFTQSRDEHVSRQPATFPHRKSTAIGSSILYPKDGNAGGTWIAASDRGRVSGLMNGAFELHQRAENYRLSRGIVMHDSFDFDALSAFADAYNFSGIEPFTMITYDRAHHSLLDLRWDGEQVHLSEVDATQPHIWSSSTLYSSEMKHNRVQWFHSWLDQHLLSDASDVMRFHREAGSHDPENAVCMARSNGVQTVSITQLKIDATRIEMTHQDLRDRSVQSDAIGLAL